MKLLTDGRTYIHQVHYGVFCPKSLWGLELTAEMVVVGMTSAVHTGATLWGVFPNIHSESKIWPLQSRLYNCFPFHPTMNMDSINPTYYGHITP